MADDGVNEVTDWFRERGFELIVSQEDGDDWSASLQRIGSSHPVISRYGTGSSPGAAAGRARERYEQEQ